jgi:hypothetical protein
VEVNVRAVYFLVLLVVLLASCESIPTGDALLTAIAQPTKTFVFNLSDLPTQIPPTPITLADIDLESIILLPGDLPDGYTGAGVVDPIPNRFGGTQGVNEIFQLIEYKSRPAGEVTIIVYDSEARSAITYDLILDDMYPIEEVKNLGEQAHITIDHFFMITELSFLRCNADVNVTLWTTNREIIISYAQRLDERITPLVCR